MDDVVKRYYQRRAFRLARRGYRLDDDEDQNNGNGNGNGGGGRGGHGNTKIPFGLCQREGIAIDPKWSPKDAWDALAGKGYSAGEVYSTLKKTGKVSGGSKGAKRAPTKIEEKHFPSGMITKTMRKNTMEAVEYVNSHCDDGNITEFISSSLGSGITKTPSIACRRVRSGEGCQLGVYFTRDTGIPTDVTLTVPMFSAYTDEGEKKQAIRSFCHEWTHYLDLLSRDGEHYGSYSQKHKELNDLIKKENIESGRYKDPVIGDEAMSIFKQYNEKYEKIKEEYGEKKKDLWVDVAKEVFGDSVPSCISQKDGSVRYFSSGYWEHAKKCDEYVKGIRKKEKELAIATQRRARSLMDGAVSLQGIYDSLYSGRLRQSDTVKYGHKRKYFLDSPGAEAEEMIADYVALKATNPKLAQVFIDDKPQIAAAMDKVIEEMTKKMRGGK